MISLRELGLLLLGTSGVTIIGYYAIINVYYSLIHFLALFELKSSVKESRWNPPFRPFDSPFFPGIAVLVPAYNEAATIEESLDALLSLNYPDSEIVVINDGSTDGTFTVLEEQFDLTPLNVPIPYDVPSEPIHNVYRSKTHEALLVIDKENGGKSDALNAGLWMTEKELFCAVDSDTLIERDALLQIVRPFLRDPKRAVASGGTIRVANDCEIENGQVQKVNLPKTGLPGLQVMEYLRAFYSGRLGLNRLRGLILISGAFGLFRSDYVREIGGYRHDTVTEDFDLVVRLHRYLTDRDLEYRVDFVPEPVAWTEVPSSRRILGRQRRRWYRGMIETLVTNRDMLFNRTYGRVGTVILPLFTAAEAIGPLVEGLGYLIIPLAWYLGAFNIEFFVVFLLLTTGFGIFLSWFGIYSEVWSYNRYDRPQEIVRLLWYGVLENFGYRQWKVLIAWQGLFEYLRGEESWGTMERSGFGPSATDSENPDSKTATISPSSGSKEEGVNSSDHSPDVFNWEGHQVNNTSEGDCIGSDECQEK